SLLAGRGGNPGSRFTVRPRHMRAVRRIVDSIEKIARPIFGRAGRQHARLLVVRVAVHGWRIAFPKVGKDQTEILQSGIRTNLDAIAKRLRLSRLLDALAVRTVFPPVVETAEIVPFHPAGRELGASVGAAERHDM